MFLPPVTRSVRSSSASSKHPYRRRPLLAVECSALESRTLMDAVFPTAYEQYFLQILNRARTNPVTEVSRIGVAGGWQGTPDLNEGVPAGTWGPEARQPLAWNVNLGDGARKHSKWMSDNNTFDHVVTINGQQSTPDTRAVAAGFPGGKGVGENLARTIAGDPTATVDQLHTQLFVDNGIAGRGHRALILNGGINEIGIGLFTGPFGGSQFTLATQNASNRGAGSFLVGAAFTDLNADQFYQPGEQAGGVTITATRTSDSQVFSTTTWEAGGYSLKLDPGSYIVTATGGAIGTPAPKTVTIGTQNVAADFIAASATPAAPVIVNQPKDLTPYLSQTTASFSVTATGNPTPTVQWQSALALSSTFTNITGATGFTYTLTHQANDNGRQFRAVLTNSAGSVTSSVATLTVQNGTPIPITITTYPKDQTVNVGDTVTFNVVATGATRYQWSLSTDGGNNSTPISGATGTSYTFVATAAMTGNVYTVDVGNSSGSQAPSAKLTVNTANAAPTVVAQPQPTPVTDGGTAPLTVVPDAFPDPDVQWETFDPNADFGSSFSPSALRKNATIKPSASKKGAWVPVDGATQTTLNVTGVLANGKRLYRAVLTNGEGSVTTAPVAVTVNKKPPLANDLTSLQTASAAALDAVAGCKKATEAITAKLNKDLKRLHASKDQKAVLATLIANETAARSAFTKNLKGALNALKRAASAVFNDSKALQKHTGDAALTAKLQADLTALRTAAASQTASADATDCKLALTEQLEPLSAVAPTDAPLQIDIEAAHGNAFAVGQALRAPVTIAVAVADRIESHAQA